jgi:sugar phosphate isomerase/epimerase
MARGEYTINNLYQPGYSSFKPGQGAPAHYLKQQGLVSAGQLGITVNPMVANQLGELSKALNSGVIPVEVGTLDMKNFDTVPKEHWDEMRRKADLTGAKVTMHAPLVDPAGFGQQNRWDETQQQLAERQLIDIMDKASQLTSKKNPQAVPVTIHAGNYAGSTYKIDPETGKKVSEQLIAVNRQTGELAPMKHELQYLPELNKEGKVIERDMSPEEAIMSTNNTQWRKEIDEILYRKESVDKLMAKNWESKEDLYQNIAEGKRDPNSLSQSEKSAYFTAQTAAAHLQDAELKLHTSFDKAYRYAEDDAIIEHDGKKVGFTKQEKLDFLQASAENYAKTVEQIKEEGWGIKEQADAIQVLAENMRKIRPKLFERVEDFAVEKASQTLSNVAMHVYDKAQDKNLAPQISLENLYQGMGFSQGEDLARMIERTRNEFQAKLMKEKGLSSTEAEKQAEHMIGATFDVGHLNISRKHGFKEEDLKKEAEALSKYINKVHLTDNFGYEDVHLPIGMGNVPVKELLEAAGEKGKQAIKINEVGGWINAFGSVPYVQTLEAAGSPIYSSGVGPYWSQTTGFQQSYSGGFGMSLPQVNYETFGAGFSQMPIELGGSRGGGAGGRMGGGAI